MTIFKDISIRTLRKQHNKNISSLFQDTQEGQIRELQKAVRDLQLEIEELKQFSVASQSVDADGKPSHGAYSSSVDGQFIQVVSLGGNAYVEVPHGLNRIPQGCLWVLNGRDADVSISGDSTNGIPPATDRTVYARHFGSAGAVSVGILF